MKISTSSRIFIIAILFISLTVLCLYYSSEYKKHLEYPSYESILSSNYPLNQLVYIQGSIIKMEADGYYIYNNYNGHDVIIKVLGQSPAGLDDEVSILGVLGPANQILNVKEIRIIYNWKYRFLLLRSLLALIFLFIIFLYFWRFDFKKIVFKRR